MSLKRKKIIGLLAIVLFLGVLHIHTAYAINPIEMRGWIIAKILYQRVENAIATPVPTISPTPIPTPIPIPLNEKVANIAQEYLGVPYVWGGTTPDGFDCSGLVQYVYEQIDIHISRTTYTQVNEGISVSQDNLKVGDLVFFGDYEKPHHVGIYMGNDCYIHAPQTGDVVKISNLSSRNDYATARRIIY